MGWQLATDLLSTQMLSRCSLVKLAQRITTVVVSSRYKMLAACIESIDLYDNLGEFPEIPLDIIMHRKTYASDGDCLAQLEYNTGEMLTVSRPCRAGGQAACSR